MALGLFPKITNTYEISFWILRILVVQQKDLQFRVWISLESLMLNCRGILRGKDGGIVKILEIPINSAIFS